MRWVLYDVFNYYAIAHDLKIIDRETVLQKDIVQQVAFNPEEYYIRSVLTFLQNEPYQETKKKIRFFADVLDFKQDFTLEKILCFLKSRFPREKVHKMLHQIRVFNYLFEDLE